MGNGKAAVYGVVLVMALLIAVMVQAQSEPPGPPPGVGNDTNAATLCDPGELLAGDSSCIQFPADTSRTNAEIQTLVGPHTDLSDIQQQLDNLIAFVSRESISFRNQVRNKRETLEGFPARTAFVMTERQRRGCPGLT